MIQCPIGSWIDDQPALMPPADLPLMNRVTRKNPCPVCGHKDWCLVNDDLSAALCARVHSGPTSRGRRGEAGTLHILSHSTLTAGVNRPAARPANRRTVADERRAAKEAEKFFSYPEAAKGRRELAEILVVSESSLERLGIGWHGSSRGYWLCPERDGDGKIIGGNYRIKGGRKKQMSGTKRGLTFDPQTMTGGGVIFLIEGMSDTAACLTMGLNAVGRPSNVGGIPYIKSLIERIDAGFNTQFVVVGERDEKPDGNFPGRDGALYTVNELRKTFPDRDIHWAFPPGGAKDSRAWLNSQPAEADRVELGKRFLESVLSALDPEQAAPTATEEIKSLPQWQQEMTAARIASVQPDVAPGVYLDTSPTGAGKSHGDRVMIQQIGSATIITPVHDNAKEIVADLLSAGIDARRYPKRISKPPTGPTSEKQNCFNPRADDVEEMGLSVLAVECRGCPFEHNCDYLRGVLEAGGSQVSVATHMRARLQGLTSLVGNRKLVSLHESAIEILRPTETVNVSSLAATAAVVLLMLSDPAFLNRLNCDQHKFILRMHDVIECISSCIASADKSGDIDLPAGIEMPGNLEPLIFEATNAADVTMPRGAWRAIIGATEGSLKNLTVQIDGDDGSNAQKRRLVAVWRNDFPETAVVWLSDATVAPQIIADLIGKQVNNATPAGQLEQKKSATQIPVDITRETSGGRVAGILRGILNSIPAWLKAGVIGHKPHIDCISRIRAHDPIFGPRIQKISWFGSGEDRGSNEWYQSCDSLIVLGTPRPSPATVRRYLIQVGKVAAAQNENPPWGSIVYTARHEDGSAVSVESRGYLDPTWQEAFQSLCRASLIQCIGRGRGVRDDGIPVLVVSTENCGLTISGLELDRLNDIEAEVIRILAGGGTGGESSPDDGCLIGNMRRIDVAGNAADESVIQRTFPNNISIRKTALNVALSAREIATAAGISYDTSKRALKSLRDRGLIERIGGSRSTKWRLTSSPAAGDRPSPDISAAQPQEAGE